jgi:gliding motility-associated lipoprotein GldK
MRGNYIVDCALYTVEAESYEANDFGLYNMAGNVAEWVDSSYETDAYDYNSTMNPNVSNDLNKRKITRGGSWKDVKYYLQVSSRDYEYEDVARSYIGFRTVHDYLGSDIEADNSQTNQSRLKK